MDELLRWLYGKSAKNAHIREMAKKTLNILKSQQSIEHQELCKLLEIGFDSYQKPKRTFYFVVNPLKKVSLINDKRMYIDSEKKKYNTVYFLTPEMFQGYMKKTLDDFHTQLKA